MKANLFIESCLKVVLIIIEGGEYHNEEVNWFHNNIVYIYSTAR